MDSMISVALLLPSDTSVIDSSDSFSEAAFSLGHKCAALNIVTDLYAGVHRGRTRARLVSCGKDEHALVMRSNPVSSPRFRVSFLTCGHSWGTPSLYIGCSDLSSTTSSVSVIFGIMTWRHIWNKKKGSAVAFTLQISLYNVSFLNQDTIESMEAGYFNSVPLCKSLFLLSKLYIILGLFLINGWWQTATHAQLAWQHCST